MFNKIVYQYDVKNVYEKPVLLNDSDDCPIRATPIEPPESKDGYEIVWKHGEWIYRKYTPSMPKTEEQEFEEQVQSMKKQCIDNMNVALLRNDDEALASVRADYADLQEAVKGADAE